MHDMVDHTLDARGLKCPLPILKAKKLLRNMRAGQRLDVLATDEMAKLDFEHLCTIEPLTLELFEEQDGVLHFVIRVNADG